MQRQILLLAGACIAIAVGPTVAAADCDETCAVVKRVLNDRAANFAGLKGSLQHEEDAFNLSDSWEANAAPLGMTCKIFELTDDAPKGTFSYGCHADGGTKATAQSKFDQLTTALRAINPTWKWFRDNDPRFPSGWGMQVFGGPSRGKFFADVWIGPGLSGGDSGNIILRILSKPISTTSLKIAPYKFAH